MIEESLWFWSTWALYLILFFVCLILSRKNKDKWATIILIVLFVFNLIWGLSYSNVFLYGYLLFCLARWIIRKFKPNQKNR